MSKTPWFTLAVCVLAGAAQPAPVAIEHTGVDCVIADRFPVLHARLVPPDGLVRVRVRFRPFDGTHWYSVPLVAEAGTHKAVLPKPKASMEKFVYYLDGVARDMSETRSQEYTPRVESGPGACKDEKVAATLGSAVVALEVPAGAPAVPLGFSGVGITPASAAGAATAGATAAGGGLSGGALVAIVGGGAAAAGVAVAVSSGDGGGGGSTSATTTTPPTTPATTAPPATSPGGGSLTGRWAGTGGDGIDMTRTTPNGTCRIFADLTMDLAQTGANVTGTATSVTRSSQPAGCDATGDSISGPVSGTLNGSTVTLSWTPRDNAFSLVGASSGNRMSGTLTGNATDGANESFAGTWAVNRATPGVQ